MTNASSDKGRPIVPPEELRCVWMSAGILSYQLCELGFDCEHCPLDMALRTHFGRGGTVGTDEPAAPAVHRRLEPDRLYSRGHCWVKESPHRAATDQTLVRVGIEPELAAMLQGPRAVVWPMPGERLERGRADCWIVTGGGTFPLLAPLTGTLRRGNPLLAVRPHLLASQPLDDGWLYEMEPAPGSAPTTHLMNAEAATHAYAADSRRFRATLARALRGVGSTAPVLADGGVPLSSLSDMLGPERYFALLCRVYG